jgi:choline dehydrogenase
VILSAGAVGTPHLLMLSGIGPGDHLRTVGIEPVVDRPGVGSNLNDHPDFVLKVRCLKPVSLWLETRALRKHVAGLRWLLRRDGVCASNHFEAVACIRSTAGVDYPDLQLTVAPIALEGDTWNPIREHAFQIHVGLTRGHSRGRISLRDADPASPPRILVDYLDDPRDRRAMRDGIRLARELLAQPAFAALAGAEIHPGDAAQSDADLDRHLAAAVATQWHLSGTARMGSETNTAAVVDAAGRVYGVAGLRVVDASIMPVVTNGNTNCPTLMIAEKLSDAVLGLPSLDRIEAEVWQSPYWQTRQR